MSALAAALVAAFLLIQAASVAAFFMLSERRDQRFAAEREAWVSERRELNQRIQAPEIATTEAIQTGSLGAVNPDDDAEYWRLVQEAKS